MIRVGMLVEVASQTPNVRTNFVGHIGTVISISDFDGPKENYWFVAGAERDEDNARIAWHGTELRPIRPDTKDIEETRQAGIQSWDGMMKELGKVISG